MSVDGQLLSGLLALQFGFISKEHLVAALAVWSHNKQKSIEEILVEQKVLTPQHHALLKQIKQEVLSQHGQSPEKSLAALSSIGSVLQEIELLADSQLNATVGYMAKNANDTITFYVAGSDQPPPREASLRYRTIRSHAKGGLGEVFVAKDEELNREVALKEIQSRYADNDESRARFRLEAEITGNLEHPGIVPVYGLGQYADGRPYYAMRFIRGDSLKEAIDAFHARYKGRLVDGDAGLELRKLLRRFVDVCNAMAYAHSRGVLHRDLKPGNIILGKYGETLIVDWGLAKAQGQGEADASIGPVTPSSDSGATPTMLGTAVGTPAYMSPEQAAGKVTELGPATDVYALGATLFHLLTGQLPISGKSPLELLKKAENGDIRRPRELRSDVPKSLEAVCLLAMAKEPRDRYESSVALAEEIEKWLADEPVSACTEPFSIRVKRWVRRHPTIVATSAACIVLGLCATLMVAYLQSEHAKALAGKNVELTIAKNNAEALADAEAIAKADAQNKQKLAEAQRERAEQREREAIDAVKRFGDAVAKNIALKNSPKLESLRKELLKEPLAFFKSLRIRLQEDKDTRPESLERLGSAAYELGVLTDEIGAKQDAIVAQQEALTIRERLAREHPSNVPFQKVLAATHLNLANLLYATGKPSEALAAYEQTKAILEPLVRENPSITELQGLLALCHSNLGVLLRTTGKWAKALAAYEQAKTIRERLAQENLSVAEFQSALAESHNNIARLYSENGRAADALVAYEQAKTIQERLARENPTFTEFQCNLAASLLNLGNLLRDTGKPTEAFETYQDAKTIQERLVRENPTVTEFQRNLAASLVNLGVLYKASSKQTEAQAAYEQAKTLSERLVRENPSVIDFQKLLATCHMNLGVVFLDTGKSADALAAYKKARLLLEPLVRENPSIIELQSKLAGIHSNLGIVYNDTNKPTEALAAHEQAKTLLERLMRENPSVTEFQDKLAICHMNCAALLHRIGNPSEALTACEHSKTIFEQLVQQNPSVTAFQAGLADIYNSLGTLLKGLGKPSDSVDAHEQAKSIFERLSRENPSVSKFQAELASCHLRLGAVLSDTGKSAEALLAFDQAQIIQERLIGANPSALDLQHELGITLHYMADIRLADKQFAEANKQLRMAMQHLLIAHQANPLHPIYRQNLNALFATILKEADGLQDDKLNEVAERGLVELAKTDPQFVELDARLTKVLEGDLPKDATELLAFAQRAYALRRYAIAARFFGEAIERDSALTESRKEQVAYDAACCAVLAASGKSFDEPPLDEMAKAKHREQAFVWLKSELLHWEKTMDELAARPSLVQTLSHWQKDSNLASVRDTGKLEKIPEAERKDWEAFWDRVKKTMVQIGTEQ